MRAPSPAQLGPKAIQVREPQLSCRTLRSRCPQGYSTASDAATIPGNTDLQASFVESSAASHGLILPFAVFAMNSNEELAMMLLPLDLLILVLGLGDVSAAPRAVMLPSCYRKSLEKALLGQPHSQASKQNYDWKRRLYPYLSRGRELGEALAALLEQLVSISVTADCHAPCLAIFKSDWGQERGGVIRWGSTGRGCVVMLVVLELVLVVTMAHSCNNSSRKQRLLLLS